MNDKSTLNKRVIIPHNVADAIEELRSSTHPYDNERIVYSALNLHNAGDAVVALRTIPFDTLLAALVNEYEREKTPEEIAHERVRIVFEKRIQSGTSARDAQEITRNLSFADGIKFALNELGVNIEGVNA